MSRPFAAHKQGHIAGDLLSDVALNIAAGEGLLSLHLDIATEALAATADRYWDDAV